MQRINALNISNTLANALQGNKQLNANLPMLLEILSKKGADKFMVQLGKLVVETTSNKELVVGARYWANVKNGKDGIIISNLARQPELMKNIADSNLKLTQQDVKELIQQAQNGKQKIEDVFKEFLLERLPLVQSKQDFLELANLLVALQKGVLSMVIQDQQKDSLLQIQPRATHLDFYCVFQHLGTISGLVYMEDGSMKIRMQVMNERVKDALESNLGALKGFSECQIDVAESVPLWDLSRFNGENILDIRI